MAWISHEEGVRVSTDNVHAELQVFRREKNEMMAGMTLPLLPEPALLSAAVRRSGDARGDEKPHHPQ